MPVADLRARIFWVILLFGGFTCLMPWFPGFDFDTFCWTEWSKYIFRNGLGNAYESGTNYMPLYQYFLWAFGKLAGSEASIATHIAFIRCFTLVFEFWGLWMIWKWGQLKINYPLLVLLSLLNIGFSYNTLIWGQTDTIVATLALAALYAAYRQKLLLSGIAMVLCVNMKMQGIIFVPLWSLLVINALPPHGSLCKFIRMMVSAILVQLLVMLPFVIANGINGVKQVWNVVINSAGYFSVLSMNAYNLWYWVSPNPIDAPDTTLSFLNISYRNIGLILFATTSVLAMLPIGLKVWGNCSRGKIDHPISRTQLWLSAALVALLFFFCNTQMHERYAHPAFIFITAYAFTSRKFFSYTLLSCACFLNLEGVLQWLKLPFYHSFIFDGRWIAGLFALLIANLFFELYRDAKFFKKTANQTNDSIKKVK